MSGSSVGIHTCALLLSHCQGAMEMQCTSYLSGYRHAGDLNVRANGKRWSLYNNIVWKGGQAYNNLLTPTAANQELEDYKEALRQMMLKHEATFKDQVRELHCLYWRQREIMNELRLELPKHPSQLQTSLPNTFPSQMPSEFAKEARLVPGFPCLNAPTGRVSFLMESLQSSSFVGTNGIAAISVTSFTNNTSEDCILLSSKSKTSGRVFDLELPADEYIDTEEGEQLKGERVCEVPDLPYLTPNCISQFHPNRQLKSFLCGGRSTSACQVGVSRTNADSQKTCDLFDLNEPILLEEAARREVSHQDQNFSRVPSSSFQCLTERVVLRGKELEIHADNVHVVKDRQRELLSYSDVIGKNGSNLNYPQRHSSSKNSPQPSCAEKTNAEVKFSERNHVIFSEKNLKSAQSSICSSTQLASQYDTAKSEQSSVLCQRNVARIPIAVQALPCFNASVAPYGNKSPLNGNAICSVQPSLPPGSESESPTTSSSLNVMECVNDKQFTSKHHDLPTGFKVTSCTDTDAAKGIDLNSIPPVWSPGTTETQEDMKFDFGVENHTNMIRDFHWLKNKNNKPKSCDLDERKPFSEQDLSTRSSSSSHKNPPESNDTENSGKASIPAEHLPHDVAFNLGKCDKGEQDLEVRIPDKLETYVNHIDLNSCTNEDKSSLTTLDASIKTENLVEIGVGESMDKKCSLLGEESKEHQHRTSQQLSEKDVKEPQEDVRIAAEAIVSISSSGVQPILEKTPFEAFCESLYWFAGIVAYMENDKSLETVLNGVADSDCDELLPEGIDYFEAMTLMLTETKTEDFMSTSNAPEVKETGDNLLPSKPSRGQMTRGRRRKDFQTVVLPSLASLSRYEVREDLHLIGGLMQAAGTGLDTSLGRRNAVKTVGKRGRRRSGIAASSGVDNTMCFLLRQQSHGIEVQVGKGGLTGWGENNKGRRAQRPSTRKLSRN